MRFAIVAAMRYFLDNCFTIEKFERVISVRSEEYYVNMAIAWYLSVALVKQYDSVLPYLKTSPCRFGFTTKVSKRHVRAFAFRMTKKSVENT